MVDNRFKDFPIDYRFPSPGVDVRFQNYPIDGRFPSLGLDTQFMGSVYGSGGITGTAPVLASLVNGNTLSTKVTWGSYSGNGAVTTTKQMKLNAGSWVAYVGGTVVNTGEMWTVRELCSDSLVTDQPFTSGFQIVISTALVPSTFGIGDWIVRDALTSGDATFTIYRLPSDNGSALTALQYRIGAGSWTSFGGLTVGDYAVAGLTDGVQNSMTIRAVNAIGNGTASAAKFVTTTTGASLVTGNSATIVAGGVTWTLSTARNYGVTDTGVVTVDWTSGLTVLSRSPAATTDGGYDVNGTMKNPVRSPTGDNFTQGWHEAADTYSAGANQSFPISTADNDIVVGAVHSPGGYASESLIRQGLNLSYSALYFKAGGLPVNAVAPAMIGWAGRGTPVAYNMNIVDVAASMPSYDLTGIPYPTAAWAIAKLNRFNPAVGATEETAPGGYEALLANFTGDTGNYGQSTGAVIGAAALHLVGNVATTVEKQTLLASLVRLGVQWYDPVKGIGVSPVPDGGHWQFQLIPIAMALHYLGRGSALDTLHTDWTGNFFGQSYLHTATSITNQTTPHSDTAKPMTTRRRTLSAVSGLNMNISTYRVPDAGDLYWLDCNGMLLVRESDNDTALITAMPGGSNTASGTSSIQITIDAQPSPAFANGDTVYMVLPATFYEGDGDWRGNTGVYSESPNPAQSYRPQSKWSDDVLGLRAQGIWRDAWQPAEQWVARSNRIGDPSSTVDYANNHDTANSFAFAEGFWNNHAASVVGSYPVVVTHVSLSGTGADGTVLTATPAVVGPSTGLTRTYQWYNNGVAIGGQTASTYTVVTGDIGDSLTVWETIVNAYGTQISRSGAVIGNAGYSPNAVQAGIGVAVAYASGMSGMPVSKQGSFVITFRKRTSWENGPQMFSAQSTAGGGGLEFQQRTSGALELTLYNTGGSVIANFLTATSEFAVGTYYTVACSWDTATQVFVIRKRAGGGSWVTVTPTSSSITLNEETAAIGRFGLCCVNSSGGGAPTDIDIHDFWVDFGQKPDFTNAGVLASFLPTVSKGATGSLPTGTAPHFYFSGPSASFGTNDGLSGGLTVDGTFVTAGAQPT